MAKLKKRLQKFVGRNICTAVEIFGQGELKRGLWYAKMALTLSKLTKAPNRHTTQQSNICSHLMDSVMPLLEWFWFWICNLDFPSVHPLFSKSHWFCILAVFFCLRRDVFSLHESVTWPCWIESGLLKEIKLTWLPVVHGLICLIIDDDIYIMMQCLFVTFLFIPAPPPAPLPRPELLCLDKT